MKESNIKINLSKNTISEIKDTLSNQKTNINSMVKLKEYTPKQLVDAGVSNLPMLVRKGHLRENILTIQEAQIKGFSTKGKHYHGLGIETYIKAIISMDNPIAIYRYTNLGNYSINNFIVLTSIKDKDNNNIIIPIEINRKGQYNNVEIDTNIIKTTYGKNNKKYFINKLNSGEIIEIYNKKRGLKPSVQSGSFKTSSNTNISDSHKNVKPNISNK
ncbi:MAG: hypothetical protein HFH47_01400 [Bacilli bacterium]|nr:hypothetical protein [Bacilli bacterium]